MVGCIGTRGHARSGSWQSPVRITDDYSMIAVLYRFRWERPFGCLNQILQESNRPLEIVLRHWVGLGRPRLDPARSMDHIATELNVLV